MRAQIDSRSWQQRPHLVAIFFSAISLQLLSGLSVDPVSSSDKGGTGSPSSSNNKTGLEVLYILLGIVAFVLIAFFLFKMWQKKKREEQHARLLRLFEEDDELEVELGLRD